MSLPTLPTISSKYVAVPGSKPGYPASPIAPPSKSSVLIQPEMRPMPPPAQLIDPLSNQPKAVPSRPISQKSPPSVPNLPPVPPPASRTAANQLSGGASTVGRLVRLTAKLGVNQEVSVQQTSLSDASSDGVSKMTTIHVNPSHEMNKVDQKTLDTTKVSKLREAWISNQVELRSSEFLSFKDLRIHALTWNVNGKLEEMMALSALLDPDLDRPADIYAIGLEEMIELSAANVVGESIIDTKSRDKKSAWIGSLLDTLNFIGNSHGLRYSHVVDTHMVGIFLAVFCLTHLCPLISLVQTGEVARGAGGILGNKGGVAISFNLYDSSLCFVSAHFTAHRDKVSKRNRDYEAISCKPLFYDRGLLPSLYKPMLARRMSKSPSAHVSVLLSEADQYLRYDSSTRQLSQQITGRQFKDELEAIRFRLLELQEIQPVDCMLLQGNISVLDHDVVVWMGDLNYRIEESAQMCDVYNLIKLDRCHDLQKLDQLNIERMAGRVFQGFSEGLLTFPPTYKYIAGLDVYDDRPEKKLRCPAYCDRVLWALGGGESAMNESLKLLAYRRGKNVMSDHKPVYAVFAGQLKEINAIKREQVLASVYADWLVAMDSLVCEVRLSDSYVWFSGVPKPDAVVTPNSIMSKTIQLTNANSISSEMSIVASSVPDWLIIEPRRMMLEGHGACEVELKVDRAIAHTISEIVGQTFLCTLVAITVRDGDDVLLPVSASLLL